MKRVKQLIAMLLVLVMAVGMVACGNSAQDEQATTQGTATADAQEPTVAEMDNSEPAEEETQKESAETKPPIEKPVLSTGENAAEQPQENNETAAKDPTDAQENTAEPSKEETSDKLVDATEKEEAAQSGNTVQVAPKGEYNKGVVLVKAEGAFSETDLGDLEYTSVEPLYKGSDWYSAQLTNKEKTEEAVAYLTSLGTFAGVDYDYVMAADAKEEENPKYSDQVNLGLSNIPHGWTVNGKAPGGSPDVVVAVIDTGVDYTHLDLRNNIWINTAEIPDNGKDDDNNGYVDDVYGWDCVGNDNNPMDDNGHGTHVAGIIAAENNKEGGIGVAYNCKVMVLKAGNSSGYFNNSDIAEAVQYAYMNGASVINMSFGGSNISIVVEDALKNAYNSCVLVAAAGNDRACNNLECRNCNLVKVSYPAALPFVIGVMSADQNGKHMSYFSNYDHYPYDSVEYEVFAVGEGVGSTWPSNKYACLNGTSMAAPTVAGIAALLRSYYADREMYSTKFIQSQIVNTGTICLDGAHTVADAQEALTKLPKPAVNLYDYFIDDSTAISTANNGNGVVDAGETVRLHISLHNRGGVASNVNVSIDTYRSEIGDETLTDPYFTFANPTMQLSDIGTYSVRESGDKYFEIIVSPDCPNDYLVDFNIRYTYTNGMDEKDKETYPGDDKARFTVSNGYHLPNVITEDTVFTNKCLYIIGQDLIIPEGVSVTFEEGAQIQVYHGEVFNSPRITVYGSLLFNGTKENHVNLFLAEEYYNCPIIFQNYGSLRFMYTDAENVIGEITKVQNSRFYQRCTSGDPGWNNLVNGQLIGTANSGTYLSLQLTTIEAIDCYFDVFVDTFTIKTDISIGCYYYLNTQNFNTISSEEKFDNNVIVSTLFDCSRLSKNPNVLKGNVSNNIFLAKNGKDSSNVAAFDFSKAVSKNNYFDEQYRRYAPSIFENFYLSTGATTVDVYGSLSDPSALWPYVVSVEMFNQDGDPITTIGNEEIRVRVTFNRPMDTTKDTYLTFGTIEPYADYKITGSYVSDTVWEGSYALKAQIENGQNFLKVNNACAAEDPTKTVFGEYQLREFTIDTTAAMSMNLQAVAMDEGIQLTFAQDDYDTLLGYNIYRSIYKDGNFVKLNPTILLPTENTFLDENAEPGKTYWYTYTAVLSDFTESNPAGKVQATAKDTMAPSLYHTPVNQGYENNNLVISCTASDNVAIETVTLYYRATDASEWKCLVMSKQNDKYSATIFGSDVTLAGVQYYIVAADANNTVNKGSAEAPYTVVIKSADSLLGKGDVDGNGTVTTKDALMLMQCLNGDLLLADDAFKRADLNGDSLLSSAEALRILQYVNGKIATLDM